MSLLLALTALFLSTLVGATGVFVAWKTLVWMKEQAALHQQQISVSSLELNEITDRIPEEVSTV